MNKFKKEMLESPVQLELRLVKLNKTSAPNPTTCTSSTNSLSSSRSSAHTPDLLDDLLNENPFLSPEQSFQSSSNASVKSRQTNILSFLSSPSTSSSERSSNERTPQGIVTKAKNSCSLKSSRALFPPVSSKSMKQRKRELSDTALGPPKPAKKKRKKEDMDQLQLDCGQKILGHATCKVCGMVYTHSLLDDQVEHSRFHSRYITGVSFPGWKHERVVALLDIGRIIMVLPCDWKQHPKKLEDIRTLVDHDLGYSVSLDQTKRQFTVFVCVGKRKIMGCVFTEQIKQGYEVLCDESSSFDNLTAWYSSTEPQPAVLGINRLWVAANCRRMGVASKLLNAARTSLIPNILIPKDKIAFTDPTPDGKLFASHYCERTNFLVYR